MKKYNTKRYFWLKLKEDHFRDPRIKKLRKIAGGDTYTIIILKMMLLTLKDNGLLTYQGIEKTMAEELSLILDEDADNIAATLIFMEKFGLMEKQNTNQYFLPQVHELTGSESDSAPRKRDERARKKQLPKSSSVTLSQISHNNVQTSHKNVTTEKEKELEIEKELELELELELEKKKEKEKKPLSKSLSKKSHEDFYQFVDRIRSIYKNQKVLKGPIKITDTLTYTKDVTISITDLGQLYNDYYLDELTYEAKPLWNWMYKNQDRLLPIN